MFQGHGVECASIGEVLHALDIGFLSERIVFDSDTSENNSWIKYDILNQVSLSILVTSGNQHPFIILSCVQNYACYEIHVPYIFLLWMTSKGVPSLNSH